MLIEKHLSAEFEQRPSRKKHDEAGQECYCLSGMLFPCCWHLTLKAEQVAISGGGRLHVIVPGYNEHNPL